jgi:hypothetical protein
VPGTGNTVKYLGRGLSRQPPPNGLFRKLPNACPTFDAGASEIGNRNPIRPTDSERPRIWDREGHFPFPSVGALNPRDRGWRIPMGEPIAPESEAAAVQSELFEPPPDRQLCLKLESGSSEVENGSGNQPSQAPGGDGSGCLREARRSWRTLSELTRKSLGCWWGELTVRACLRCGGSCTRCGNWEQEKR